MITTIYLVRHANKLRLWNAEDKLRPLTLLGETQARFLADLEDLQGINFIFSSPYFRAIQTVKYLSEKIGIPIATIEDLKERQYGNIKKIPENYEADQWIDFNYTQHGGESLKMVQERMINTLNKVLKDNLGKTILICSHATAIATLFNYYNHSFNFTNFNQITSPDMWRLEFDNLVLNRIDHINLFEEEEKD